MKYKLIFSARALQAVDSIATYVGNFGNDVNKYMQSFHKEIQNLKINPTIGMLASNRLVYEQSREDLRYLVVKKKYIVIYFVDGDSVHIAKIRFSRSNWVMELL